MDPQEEETNEIEMNSHEFQKIISKISSWKMMDNFVTFTIDPEKNILFISAKCDGGNANIEILESNDKVSH